MDDLAREAGVSKKTIYQVYKDKSELVNQLVDDLVCGQSMLFKTSETAARDAVEEVLLKMEATLETWAPVSQSFFLELERSFPDAWQKLVQHKQKVMLPGIVSNLQRGISEGLYRSDLDVAFIANLSLHQHESVLQTNSFTHAGSSTNQVFSALTHFFLQGICSQKGKQQLNKYINRSNENS